MRWHQLRITAASAAADAIEDTCLELGAVAITLTDAGDEPVLEPRPGETPLWPDLVVTALFDENEDPEHLRLALVASGVPNGAIKAERVNDRDWQTEWLRDFKARNIGPRLRIVASHQDEPADERLRIVLDPGLAFGTGAHTTTALCLEWLQQDPLSGLDVLDMGCGSGILAIAALKLGAAAADGVDIDAQALAASEQNAAINGVAERFYTYAAGTLPDKRYDVVVANILANTLDTMAPELADRMRPGGRIALTGILTAQADPLLARYQESFAMQPAVHTAGWVLLTGVRR